MDEGWDAGGSGIRIPEWALWYAPRDLVRCQQRDTSIVPQAAPKELDRYLWLAGLRMTWLKALGWGRKTMNRSAPAIPTGPTKTLPAVSTESLRPNSVPATAPRLTITFAPDTWRMRSR